MPSKLKKFQLEEKKLRVRVRELVEQNVSLLRKLSVFHENETKNKDLMSNLKRRVEEVNTTADELHEDNSYLQQTLCQLQESYARVIENLDFVRRNFEEKDRECIDLHKFVSKFLRTCKEQGKTIKGFRDLVSRECKKQPSDKLWLEKVRLIGVKEVESIKLETDSLRHENISLLNRLKEMAKR